MKLTGQTGVEMEALTAVSVACLTLYDMLKAVDRDMSIEGIRLIEKSGGRSGEYRHAPRRAPDMALLPVDEALRRVLDGATPVGTESVDLFDAAERVLAEDVTATLTQPPFNASAMDGYAVRAADVGKVPAELRVIGESNAGGPFDRSGRSRRGGAHLHRRAACRQGADAVVIQEDTERAGDSHHRARGSQARRQHPRRPAATSAPATCCLRAGRLLDASAITLAAAGGHATLQVRRAPRIAILATGDELVEPGTQAGPRADRVVEPLWPRRAGQALRRRRQAPRHRRRHAGGSAAKLATAADADVLVTIGGASVGDRDLVKPALEARGSTLDFWKVAVRPGKPMLFGRLDAHARAGAAGQPALLPHRGAHLPRAADLPPARDAAIRHCARAPPSWRTISRPTARASTTCAARWRRGQEGLPHVTALTSQDSSHMSALAAADVLIVRPPNAPMAHTGQVVRILPLDL